MSKGQLANGNWERRVVQDSRVEGQGVGDRRQVSPLRGLGFMFHPALPGWATLFRASGAGVLRTAPVPRMIRAQLFDTQSSQRVWFFTSLPPTLRMASPCATARRAP